MTAMDAAQQGVAATFHHLGLSGASAGSTVGLVLKFNFNFTRQTSTERSPITVLPSHGFPISVFGCGSFIQHSIDFPGTGRL
jgi:choline-glycine betaine transporter